MSCQHHDPLKNLLKVAPCKQLFCKSGILVPYALLKGGKRLPILSLISHVVYKKSCANKSHAFNAKPKEFNVSLSSKHEYTLVEEEGL